MNTEVVVGIAGIGVALIGIALAAVQVRRTPKVLATTSDTKQRSAQVVVGDVPREPTVPAKSLVLVRG
jgi:mannose/fructose/N-acetylgalactosamine-specific phosphotransferase system component IIC